MTLVISLLIAQSLSDGIFQFRQGDYRGAAQRLSATEASPGRDVFLGLSYVALGNCDHAAPLLSKRFEFPDLRRMAGLGLAQCAMTENRVGDANEALERLRREFPDDADVLYQSARFHMRAFNDAVARMFDRTPASFRVNQLSGEILELQGRQEDAITEYRKAIAKNPAAVNLHFRLGRALLMESKLDPALAEFEAELKLNPNDALAEYQIAQILQVRGDTAQATSRFQRALALKPDFVEAMIALAKAQKAESIPLLEKAVRLAPANESARYALMIAYRNAGRMTEAEAQKTELDRLQRPPEGEFTEFLKRLGERPKP